MKSAISAKSPSPTRRAFGLLMVFLLVVGLLPLVAIMSEPVQAQSYPILIERGPNFQRWDLDNGKFAWESAPQWVYDNSTDNWAPYIYSHNEKYHIVQSGLIGAKIYIEKTPLAEFWNPNMSDLRVKSEIWKIEKWDGTNWTEGRIKQSRGENVIENGNNITISRSFETEKPSGILRIDYIFREGSALKHEVVWASGENENVTVRVKQVWNLKDGTSKVKLGNGTTLTDGKFKSTYYLFQSGVDDYLVFESQWKMMHDESGEELTEGCFTGADIEFAGKEVTYIFENWTLSQNQSLVIDPDTATFSDPTEDGYVGHNTIVGYYRNAGLNLMEILRGELYEGTTRGYVEWDISSIPGGATVSNTVFKYHGYLHEADCHIHEMLGARPTTSGDHAVFDEAGEGTVYASPAGFPVVGANQEVDLGASADSDLQSQLSSDWFAISIQLDDEGTVHNAAILAEESSDPFPTPPPTLYVEYDSGMAPNPPTLLLCEGQTNPTKITNFTPSFSGVYTDNDVGDDAVKAQIWVGTSAGDNSLWDSSTAKEDFDDGNIDGWTTGGDANWSVDANYHAKAGTITNNESTWIQRTFDNATSVTFSWKVSSEEDYDFLKFYVNDVEKLATSGKEVWTVRTEPLSGGSSVLKWEYSKDESGYGWDDTGWVDNIIVGLLHYDIGTVENGQRCPDIQYKGSALSGGITYYWQIRFEDSKEVIGYWSTESATFRIATANTAPEILNSHTPATVDPNSAFDVKVEVRDNDLISDIDEIYLKIYAEAKVEGDADSVRDHYTFKWARVGGWSEVGPDTGGSHINEGNCVPGDDGKTTDNFLFNIVLGSIACPGDWDVWAKVIDSASEYDSEEFLAKFSVNDYLSLTIDDATLTFSGDPGDSGAAASEDPTIVTVSSNTDFNIQVKLSGNWSGSTYGGSILMANTHADQDGSSPWDLDTLTAVYQDLWSSVGWGEDVQRDVHWFLDFPLPLRDDVYQTTFYVNGVNL